VITSSQNAKLKLVRTLQGRPKERREAGAFLAEGVRLLEEAQAADWGLRFVLYDETLSERGRELLQSLQAQGVDVEQVAAHLMKAISETETPQGILAALALKPLPVPAKITFALIPDEIRDPGNLGTLLRTALAAGVEAVFIPPETADAFAPKVVRAGMGAHFRLPVLTLGWDEIRTRLSGLQVYLADAAGDQACWQAEFRYPLALIVGGEAEGASRSARQLADGSIHIPMPGQAESLNAGVAGAILMFEVVRQRQ
jgi:RNA methyltransferase, TrmH family